MRFCTTIIVPRMFLFFVCCFAQWYPVLIHYNASTHECSKHYTSIYIMILLLVPLCCIISLCWLLCHYKVNTKHHTHTHMYSCVFAWKAPMCMEVHIRTRTQIAINWFKIRNNDDNYLRFEMKLISGGEITNNEFPQRISIQFYCSAIDSAKLLCPSS